MTPDPYNYRHFDRYVESGQEAAEFAAFPDPWVLVAAVREARQAP